MTDLTCFKAYDIRGKVEVNINNSIAYKLGHAVANHFKAKIVVLGFDARETSPAYAKSVAQGIIDTGADVLNLGMAGTEEMYWAVTEFKACAGIEVTASHNPIDYNGMKIVKSKSRPLDNIKDFEVIKALANSPKNKVSSQKGQIRDISKNARNKYVDKIVSFIDLDNIKPIKIVVNSGNGAAGPTLDSIIGRLEKSGVPISFIRMHHQPDSTFPNGIPNPLLRENQSTTGETVLSEDADMGVAFDGDFDRCFFFDNKGKFVQSDYIISLLASVFLNREKASRIVHDRRAIWNIEEMVLSYGGSTIQSKIGHVYFKKEMRDHQAIYGGEISAHHYFRDFAYCDSGMIPWLIIAELISMTKLSLFELIKNRSNLFNTSGEINFVVDDASVAIDKVLKVFQPKAIALDETDGISLSFTDWRFNLRKSNTEPLIRLNLETRGRKEDLARHVEAITAILKADNS